jgi:allantoicase
VENGGAVVQAAQQHFGMQCFNMQWCSGAVVQGGAVVQAAQQHFGMQA